MKNIYRRKNNRVIAGVCGGIADYLGIDAVWIRLAFVALFLMEGSGILLYLIAWLLIPEKSGEQELDPWNEKDNQKRAEVGGVLLIGTGLLLLARHLGLLSWLNFGTLLPIVLIVAGGVLIMRNRQGAHS